jgi:hypothetical protein
MQLFPFLCDHSNIEENIKPLIINTLLFVEANEMQHFWGVTSTSTTTKSTSEIRESHEEKGGKKELFNFLKSFF